MNLGCLYPRARVEKNQATKTKEKWYSSYILIIRWGSSITINLRKGRGLPNHNYLLHLILSYISLDGPTCFREVQRNLAKVDLKSIPNCCTS